MIPFLLVLSSPSGGGKSTIRDRLIKARKRRLSYSVSATTRARRTGERNGRDYFFLSREEFGRRERAGEFLETASYGGERYGTARREVERILAKGRIPVLEIEVQGARQVRRRFANAVHVFVLPPSGRALMKRLAARGTEDPAGFRRRMETAGKEFDAVSDYDYVVVNDDLDTAVERVVAILDAETQRVTRQEGLAKIVRHLRREVLAVARSIKKR
ncbi:MAG: guanylate kinase [Gemmatimonadales bacterium]